MPKPFLLVTIVLVVTLSALMACTGATPAPDPTETPTPTGIAATPALPAISPTPEATAPPSTPTSNPPVTPTATPASTLTHEAITNPAPDGRLAPIVLQDSFSLQSALSESELRCIGNDPEALTRALTGAGPSSREEQARLLACLEDETLTRLFLAGFVPGPEPLSLEASECVKEAFGVIDPRSVMMAGIEGNPSRAIAGSMAAMAVTIACLSDDESAAIERMTVMGSEEREAMQCLMEELGGPAQMVEAVISAQEVHFTTYSTPEEALKAAKESDSTLNAAAAACEMDMAPGLGQTATTPPASTTTPMPTETPTPTSTTTLVITVAAVPGGIPDYDRSDWKHWTDEDGDCQDARQEVLIAESLVAVTFETDRECEVASGRWFAAFTGTTVGDPGDLDVDHLVPLKNAHNSGAAHWSPERKEEYANYLADPDHLIAVTRGANRSKGARGLKSGGLPTSPTGALTPRTGPR